MQVESFWVGGIECRVVIHGAGRGTPAWLFPNVPPADLHRAMAPFVDRDGQFRFVYSSLVVRVGGLAVLLDAGFPQDGETRVSRLDDALGAVGLSSDDVHAVVVSHGHLDHIAGLTTDSGGARIPSFEHASHFVHQREFEYWTADTPPDDGSAAAHLRPLAKADRLELVTDEREVVPGVRLLPTPGHTPGHLSVSLTSNGQNALYVGDALAHEVNVANADWNHFSDMLAGPAIRSRCSLIERALRGGHLILGAHMVERGRVVTSGTGNPVFMRESELHQAAHG